MFVKAMMPDRSRSQIFEIFDGELEYGVAPSEEAFDALIEEWDPPIINDEFVIGPGRISWAKFLNRASQTVLVGTTGDMFTLKESGKTLERVK